VKTNQFLSYSRSARREKEKRGRKESAIHLMKKKSSISLFYLSRLALRNRDFEKSGIIREMSDKKGVGRPQYVSRGG